MSDCSMLREQRPRVRYPPDECMDPSGRAAVVAISHRIGRRGLAETDERLGIPSKWRRRSQVSQNER